MTESVNKKNTVSGQSAALASELDKLLSEPQPLNKVSERDFIDTYLPIAAAYHSKTQFDTGYWAGMAGSVYNGLTVVDDVGDPLFSTPPLVNLASVRVESGFANMIQAESVAAKNNANLYDVSSKHLNQDTIKLSIPDVSSNVIGWHKIFARYGYKMVAVDGENVIEPNRVESTPVAEQVESTSRDGEDEFL